MDGFAHGVMRGFGRASCARSGLASASPHDGHPRKGKMKRLKDKDVRFSASAGEPGSQDAGSGLARSAAPAATRQRRRGIGIAGLWAVVVLAASLSLVAPAGASTLGAAAGLTPTIESDKAHYAPA